MGLWWQQPKWWEVTASLVRKIGLTVLISTLIIDGTIYKYNKFHLLVPHV
jgi:hypothetical protein